MNATAEQTHTLADDLRESIAQSATIVVFRGGWWQGEVLDRRAQHDLTQMKKAAATAAKVHTSLLGGNDGLLRDVKSKVSACRNAYRMNTVGFQYGRLLPNVQFPQFVKNMAKHQRELDESKAAFVEAYPSLIAKAKDTLLGEFNDHNLSWPDPENIANRFYAVYDFYPVGKHFTGLPPKVIEVLEQKAEERLHKQFNSAMEEACSRLREYVDRAVTQLKSEKPVFRKTLFPNIKNTAEMIEPFVNSFAAGDQRLHDILAEARSLCDVDVDTMKKDTAQRGEAAEQAERISQVLKDHGF